jgi:hypothetical protein
MGKGAKRRARAFHKYCLLETRGHALLCPPYAAHRIVMPGLVPGIHVFLKLLLQQKRGWPGQARP